jgi:hypothetical protein
MAAGPSGPELLDLGMFALLFLIIVFVAAAPRHLKCKNHLEQQLIIYKLIMNIVRSIDSIHENKVASQRKQSNNFLQVVPN